MWNAYRYCLKIISNLIIKFLQSYILLNYIFLQNILLQGPSPMYLLDKRIFFDDLIFYIGGIGGAVNYMSFTFLKYRDFRSFGVRTPLQLQYTWRAKKVITTMILIGQFIITTEKFNKYKIQPGYLVRYAGIILSNTSKFLFKPTCIIPIQTWLYHDYERHDAIWNAN